MIEISNKELSMLDHALAQYIDAKDTQLAQENSRDEDWTRLSEYRTLNRKIEDYLIQNGQSCTG